MRVTCIGVGNMGGAVARRMAREGFDVTVFDLDLSAMDRCVEAGARRSNSMNEAVQQANVVLTSLPTTDLVVKTVAQLAEMLGAGTIVADISTIDPQTARIAESACQDHALRFVACALGKTPTHAENGAIPLFVGGDDNAIAELDPLLRTIGEETFIFDDVEGATTFKLVSNYIGMTNVATLAEGLSIARSAGIPMELFTEALTSTGAVSFQSEVRLPWMIAHDWSPKFAVDLAAKDVSLAISAAQNWGQQTPIGDEALKQLRAASAQGYGGEDVVAVAKLHFGGADHE